VALMAGLHELKMGRRYALMPYKGQHLVGLCLLGRCSKSAAIPGKAVLVVT